MTIATRLRASNLITRTKGDGSNDMIGSLREKPSVTTCLPNCDSRAAVSPSAGDKPSLAHEIHDGFVQDAFGAKMLLDSVLALGRLPEGETRVQVQRAAELVEKALCESRRLISGMRLPELEALGAVSAIETMIEDLPPGAPAVRFVTDVQHERLDYATEVAVYRIVQQALHNVCRHSRADQADVRLFRRAEHLHLEIEDRGIGFDPAKVNEDRFGLQGIRQRARLLHGRAVIESAPGKGTRIVVDLPAANAVEQ
jgi:signal transduction histidine kinase